MYTADPRPGKFERNDSQWAAEAAYAASLDGAEFVGDSSSGPESCALVEGRRYTALVWEDVTGFVTVDFYRDRAVALENFERARLILDYPPES